jgi:hypothetical protein
MTIAFGMILLGSLLVYCGWKNVSVAEALRGNNTVARKPITKSGAGVVTS